MNKLTIAKQLLELSTIDLRACCKEACNEIESINELLSDPDYETNEAIIDGYESAINILQDLLHCLKMDRDNLIHKLEG